MNFCPPKYVIYNVQFPFSYQTSIRFDWLQGNDLIFGLGIYSAWKLGCGYWKMADFRLKASAVQGSNPWNLTNMFSVKCEIFKFSH